MIFIAGLLIALAGLFVIALGQPKYARVILQKPPSPSWRRSASVVGYLLLLLSLWLGIVLYGLGIGMVAFCAWLCAAGWVVVLVVTRMRG